MLFRSQNGGSRSRALEAALWGAFANVQPHSGAQTNYAAETAFARPGDTVIGMDLSNGGHLTHGSPANFSGRLFDIKSYGLDPTTERIDYDDVEAKARESKPAIIIAGASAYPRTIDFDRFAQIAHDSGAILMVDMAHIAGIVAAGLHPNPVPCSDVVTSTTHKTLRGTRGGLILWNNPDYTKRINSAVFPGTQGGPLEQSAESVLTCGCGRRLASAVFPERPGGVLGASRSGPAVGKRPVYRHGLDSGTASRRGVAPGRVRRQIGRASCRERV